MALQEALVLVPAQQSAYVDPNALNDLVAAWSTRCAHSHCNYYYYYLFIFIMITMIFMIVLKS